MKKDFISVEDLSRNDITELVDLSKYYKRWFKGSNKSVGGLEGRTLVNIFFEPSTRTRLSLEICAKRLRMDVSNFIADASSLLKDETLEDTVRVIDAMSADALIIRTKVNNLPQRLSPLTSASIINAGDGTNEHPSQALLDYFTIMEGFNFDHDRELNVAIVGDILHSRVANSNILMLLSMRNRVKLVGPQEWLPSRFEGACEYFTDVKEAIKDADVVITLRVQKERINNIPANLSKMEMDKNNNMPSFDHEKYNKLYGIKRGMLAKEQLLLHPGPVNHGVELDADMVYCQNSRILTQVENGVASRSAILDFLFRG